MFRASNYSEESTNHGDDIDPASEEDALLTHHPLPHLTNAQQQQQAIDYSQLGGGFSQGGFFSGGGGSAGGSVVTTDDDLNDFGDGLPGIGNTLPASQQALLGPISRLHGQQFPNAPPLLLQLARLQQQQQQQQQRKPPLHPKLKRQGRKSRADEDETSERPATDRGIFTPLQNQKAEQRRQKQQRSASSSSSASTSASSSPESTVAPVVLDQNFDHSDKMGGGRGSRNSRKSGTDKANNSSNTKQNLPNSNGDGATGQKLLSVPRKSGGTLQVIENFATYTVTTVGKGEKMPPDVLQEQTRLQCAANSHRQADTKASTERRLKIITELRGLLVTAGTEVYLLRGMRRENLELVNANKGLKEDNEALQAKVDKLKERVKKIKSTKLSVAHTMCSDESDQIKIWFQDVEWHETKFISSEVELHYVTKKVFGGRGHDKQVICRDSWVKTYCKYILQVLGGCRNYLTQELKKVAMKHIKAKQRCPTHLELLKCAKRDIDINKPEEVEFFAWYYEEVMPKLLGPDWGKTKLYYVIINRAVCPKTGNKLGTPQDEAMSALVWENNEGKWPTQSSWKADPANKDKHIKNSGGKYTTTTGGKTEYTSWSPEGLEKFNSNVAAVQEAWAQLGTEGVERVEQAALEFLRHKHGLVCTDPEQEKKHKATNKRRLAASRPEIVQKARKVVATMVIQDSDEED